MFATSLPVHADAKNAGDTKPALAVGALIALLAVRLLVYLFTGNRYGYFRDELYFLDCGRHLAAGYVDMAPLTAVYARIALLLGGSLYALRLIPFLAGAGVIALTMLMTRQLGGTRFAQAFAGLCVLIAPAVIGVDVILSMNALEPLFWMGSVAVLLAIINTGNSRLWLWIGVLLGLGLENKHSTLFFGFALTIGSLLSEQRRELRKPWIWIAGVLALVIFLPNVAWQVQHNYPTLEDLENVRRSGKNVVLGPGAFIWQQILAFSPVLFPVWLGGLAWFFRHRRTRVLAWTFAVFFVTMLLMHAKDYYLFPAYPILFAGGAVALERWLATRRLGQRLLPKVAVAAVAVALTIPIDLLMLPVLSPEKYLAYMRGLGIAPEKTEVAHEGPLPQIFGDQFGWEELVKQIANIYSALPLEERAQTGILASNYGEAGAINLFGPRHGLPRAISGHQSYFLWGPQGFHGRNLILTQWKQHADEYCDSVTQVGEHYHPFGMAEENQGIWLCRGLQKPIEQLWPRFKHWN